MLMENLIRHKHSLTILFKSKRFPRRYRRKREWVFFSETQRCLYGVLSWRQGRVVYVIYRQIGVQCDQNFQNLTIGYSCMMHASGRSNKESGIMFFPDIFVKYNTFLEIILLTHLVGTKLAM